MDVRAIGRVHPVIAKVVPALAVKQRADLHDPHIVVSVAEPEPTDLAPAPEDRPAAEGEPREQGDKLPVTPEPVERPSFEIPRLAFRHFSGCSCPTSNGKQPGHGDKIKLS